MSWRSFFLGDSAADTAARATPFDPQLAALQELRGQLQPAAAGLSPAARALLGQSRAQAELAQRQALSQAAGVRGFGAVGAQRQAGQQAALAQQSILAQGARDSAQLAAQEEEARRRALLAALGQESALAKEGALYQAQTASPGLLGTLGTVAGGLIGGLAGGPSGAVTGAQLGGTVGGGFSQASHGGRYGG